VTGISDIHEAGPRARPTRRQETALWAGIVVPPVTYLAFLEASYASWPFICDSGSKLVVYVLALLALAFVIAAGIATWRTQDAILVDSALEAVHERVRFMAGLGMVISAYFVLVVVAHVIPIVIHGPCD
jgi:hypothetical protein